MSVAASDEPSRRRALDAHQSFIVQAPAGSGKTELLIQRYLTLLATVEQPEQVVAITFTRKAAAEMRARIVEALREASAEEAPTEPHRALTHELASTALERDRARGWSLLATPRRMRIDTLDALNAWLAQQLPILSGGAAGAGIAEDAGLLYALAAQRTLDELGADAPLGAALRSLLPVLDNSQARFESLLVGLLSKRDQWLRHLAGGEDRDLRGALEDALEQAVVEELAHVERCCPSGLQTRFESFLRHAAGHCDDGIIQAAARATLEDAPPDIPGKLARWRGIALLVLTQKGAWRRSVNRNQGFPPEYRDQKQALMSVLGSLSDEEAFRDALAVVPTLPDPAYSAIQWHTLEALGRVLVHLVAELRVIFAERQTIDFIELSLSAQRALGQVDEPSELLLALDHRIRHLLIDEFQDTSRTQMKLIGLLTGGWQADDGRTLFLVGDPMQSIYRFRDAEMSLFIETREHGIGNVRCEPLILASNFRSAPAIVDWVNRAFERVFPAEDEIASGAAKFHPSTAIRETSREQAVTLHTLRGDDVRAELDRVVEILSTERARSPSQSIALLVRSRTHLFGLMTRLAAQGWPVRAIEIDAVAEVQIGQDLIGLTRALAHAGDRTAWLGVLRAPWCGLCWEDLEKLCGDAHDCAIWELMHDREHVESLTPDGRRRLLAVRNVLEEAFRSRGDMRFSQWVEATWTRLDGPACLEQAEEFDTVEQFFGLLDAAAASGDIEDPAVLETAFSRPLAPADPPGEAGIEVMTIHRAKGLEFDTVVLFGLARAPQPERARALYWMERTAVDGSNSLIMAPMSREPDRLTSFVKQMEQRKEHAERARLLYVATTRARDRLHLVHRLPSEKEGPETRSLLACVWPGLAEEFLAASIEPATTAAEASWVQPKLRRLADGFDPIPVPADPAAAGEGNTTDDYRPEYEWAGLTAVQTGVIVHRYLRQIAETGSENWSADTVDGFSGQFRLELAQLGVESSQLDTAAANVAAALKRVTADPTGRWILSPHADAASELRLTRRGPTRLEHLQLDRTFIDRETGIRWIIDYKTSTHEGGDIESFLDSEVTRYRRQLEIYASAMAEIDSTEIRVGLYFPLLGVLRSWQPGGSTGESTAIG